MSESSAVTLKVRCPSCDQKLGFPGKAVGRQARCPTCSHVFQVPEPAAEVRVVPSAPLNRPALSMPNLRIACPSCGKRLTVLGSAIGRRAKCVACEHRFVVAEPSPSTESPQPTQQEYAPEFQEKRADQNLYDDLAEAEHSAEAVAHDRMIADDEELITDEAFRSDSKSATMRSSGDAGLASQLGGAAAGIAANLAGRAAETAGPLVKGIIFSVIGAGIGAVIWCAVVIATEYEFGIVAWVVGILAGLGMHLGVRAESALAGVIAAFIAFCGVVAGKLLVVAVVLFPLISVVADMDEKEFQREMLVGYRTQEILKERGVDLEQMNEGEQEAAYESASEEAEKEIAALSDEEVQQRLQESQEKAEQEMQALIAQAQEEQSDDSGAGGFDESDGWDEFGESEDIPTSAFAYFILLFFGIYGLLFSILAMVSAYKIGASGFSFGSS